MRLPYRQMQKNVVRMLCSNPDIPQADTNVFRLIPEYITDNAICLTSVAFPEPDTVQYIHDKLISPLKLIDPFHYYYPPENLHITIKNIRTTNNPPLFTLNDIEKADKVLQDIIPRHKSFSFTFEEIVSLAGSVSIIGYCDRQLKKLVTDIDKGLKKTGLPDNKQYISNNIFFGNISLCRYTRQPSEFFLKEIRKMKNILNYEIKIETINLITCNSVCAAQSRKILKSYNLSDI